GAPEGVPAAVVATVAQLAENVKIAFDAPTNALIIEAPPEAYETLRQVIAKLDIKRPQVLVEALILEVSVGPNTLNTGVGLAGGSFFDNNDPKKGGIFGSTFPATGTPGIIDGGELDTILSGGGAAGLDPLFGALVSGFHAVNVKIKETDPVTGVVTEKVVPVPVIRAVIQASAARTDTNILSSPNILTTDNEEAEIQVGQNIPIQTAAISSTTSGTGIVDDNTLVNNSFERQDVGVILRVTPQISEGNSVRLDIENEITEVAGGELGLPILTKRSIKNTVYVADAATVVIGGIISSSLGKSSNRVPWLGDIPGLGWAFKNKSKTMRKVNLIVFLTPHIIRTPDDLRQVTNYKQKEFEAKSREALRKTDKEEREEREKETKAAAEGKTLDEYEEEYDLRRRRSPIDEALKDIKQKNLTEGASPDAAAPKASPGRKEEVIGGAPEAKAPAEDDVTGGVLNDGASEAGDATEPPAKLAAAAPAPETSAVPEPGGFTVQVGAFTDRDQAENLVDKLRAQKYDVYLSSAVTDEGAVAHRVRVGRFDKDSEASRVASKLAKEFHDDGAVPFVVELSE
ncbi:MAG: SPOR domain-containing protein, partial [Deltaproteobacteria bacterium]|nr:SPOR domain-containing protein [Deltaproteobacteria bacterium]